MNMLIKNYIDKNLIQLILFLPSVLFGQLFKEREEEMANELTAIEETVNICTNSLSFLQGDKANIQLNVISSLENLVNDELEKSRTLLFDFENCMTESSLRLDSLELLVSNYSNFDSLASIATNEAETTILNDVENYRIQIDSLQSKIVDYTLAKEEIASAINVVEENFSKEFSVMKKKAFQEIQRAEKEFQRAQRKAEAELKKKFKISLPGLK